MTQTITSLEQFERVCDVCDSRRYVIEPAGDESVARRCASCFDECPACEGEGFEYYEDDKGYEYVKPCSVCGSLDARISAFNGAHIPRKYANSSRFEDFRRLDDRGRPIGNLKEVHLRLYNFATAFTPGDQGFLLWGDVGTGKTHLLATVARYLTIDKGISTRFIEFSHLLSALRQQFDMGRGEGAVLGPLTSVPVLAIDELGKGRNNDWQLSIIDELISKRYNSGLTTLFTTNYPIEAAKMGADADRAEMRRKATLETLRERVGERIYSRLHEMSDFIEIDSPDFRKVH